MQQKIFPRCKIDMIGTYVSSDGYVMPCCWLGNHPHFQSFLDFYQIDAPQLNLKNRSLDDILNDPLYRKIENSWDTERPFATCELMCGKKPPSNTHDYSGSNLAYTAHDLSNSIE